MCQSGRMKGFQRCFKVEDQYNILRPQRGYKLTFISAIWSHLAKEGSLRVLNELHLGEEKPVMGNIEPLLGITKPAEGLNKPCQNRMAFCMRMRCWCGRNVQGVCPSFILALLISVFFAIFHMEAPENTQEFFSILSYSI